MKIIVTKEQPCQYARTTFRSIASRIVKKNMFHYVFERWTWLNKEKFDCLVCVFDKRKESVVYLWLFLPIVLVRLKGTVGLQLVETISSTSTHVL